MTKHDRLVKAAKKAIDVVYYDSSVPLHKTLESLRDIRHQVETILKGEKL